MYQKKIIDENFGTESENNVEEHIKTYFKQTVLTKTSKFNRFDFEGDTALFEVKTRRNNYNKYPSTMIGYTKIKHAEKQTVDVFFIFQFLDGNYYYKYSKDDKFEVKRGGRFDRGRPETNNYIFIPIERLIKIELN